MEKTLIIGGSGLLGSKLLDLFDDACFTYNATRIERKNAYQLDISDNNALKFLLEKVNPKTVIVTAALTDADKCEVNPELAYKINVVPFYYIIDYLKKVNGRLIQISTDYVFSGNEGNYRENDNRKPINVYGKTKMNAEDIIMNSSIDYTIIRTSGTFGLNQATGKTNFFLWIYNSLKDNKEIYLVSDQYYSPTYNSTLANAVREIAERHLSGIIHFSSKDRINRYDFGILVADIFNLEKNLIHKTIMENMKWAARRPRDSSLNNEKAIKLLNNKPINVIDELKLAKEKMREQSI